MTHDIEAKLFFWKRLYSIISNFTKPLGELVPVLLENIAIDLDADRLGLFIAMTSGDKKEFVLFGVKGDYKNDRLGQVYDLKCDFSKSALCEVPTPGIGWDMFVGINAEEDPDDIVAILGIDDTSEAREFSHEQKGLISVIHYTLQALFSQRRIIKQFQETDPLTGFLNKNGLAARIAEIESRRERKQQNVYSLAFIDLDKFKSVNSTFGEPFGDLVLKAFCKCLCDYFRPYDIKARFGGEEFVIILDELGEDLLKRFENFQKLVSKIIVENDKGRHVGIPFSGGVVDIQPDEKVEEAINRAAKLKQKAKESGRATVLTDF